MRAFDDIYYILGKTLLKKGVEQDPNVAYIPLTEYARKENYEKGIFSKHLTYHYKDDIINGIEEILGKGTVKETPLTNLDREVFDALYINLF